MSIDPVRSIAEWLGEGDLDIGQRPVVVGIETALEKTPVGQVKSSAGSASDGISRSPIARSRGWDDF